MDHIDKADLLKKIDNLCLLRSCGEIRCQDCLIGEVFSIVEKCTINNKIGQWLICSDGYFPYCSACGEEPIHGEMTDYCPHCGTYMKGDKIK